MLRACIEAQQPFVVDNTNPSIETRARYLLPAREAGMTVRGYFFAVPIGVALERNRQRAGATRVPDVAVRATRNAQQAPTFAEGFDELWFVRSTQGTFTVEEWNDEVR